MTTEVNAAVEWVRSRLVTEIDKAGEVYEVRRPVDNFVILPEQAQAAALAAEVEEIRAEIEQLEQIRNETEVQAIDARASVSSIEDEAERYAAEQEATRLEALVVEYDGRIQALLTAENEVYMAWSITMDSIPAAKEKAKILAGTRMTIDGFPGYTVESDIPHGESGFAVHRAFDASRTMTGPDDVYLSHEYVCDDKGNCMGRGVASISVEELASLIAHVFVRPVGETTLPEIVYQQLLTDIPRKNVTDAMKRWRGEGKI